MSPEHRLPAYAPIAMVTGRGAGKTTALAQWLLDGTWASPHGTVWSRRVVVSDQQRARVVADEVDRVVERDCGVLPGTWAQDRATLVESILVAPRARDALIGVGSVEVAVDDVDAVLAALLGAPVRAMTVTGFVWPAPASGRCP